MGRPKMGEWVERDIKRAFSRKPCAKGLLLATKRRPYGLYSVLGLDDPTADESVIRKTYRKACLQCHPDRLPPDCSSQQRSAATRRMQDLTAAMDFLSDPARRRKYDSLTLEIEGNYNTHRSRVHRQRCTAKEKAARLSIDRARKRLSTQKFSERRTREPRLDRKVVTTKNTTNRSHIVPPGTTWIVLKRRRKEITADKRRSKYVAVAR